MSGDGEVRGVRRTMDKLIRQQVRDGIPADQARKAARRAANTYTRAVREGREPPPPLKQQD